MEIYKLRYNKFRLAVLSYWFLFHPKILTPPFQYDVIKCKRVYFGFINFLIDDLVYILTISLLGWGELSCSSILSEEFNLLMAFISYNWLLLFKIHTEIAKTFANPSHLTASIDSSVFCYSFIKNTPPYVFGKKMLLLGTSIKEASSSLGLRLYYSCSCISHQGVYFLPHFLIFHNSTYQIPFHYATRLWKTCGLHWHCHVTYFFYYYWLRTGKSYFFETEKKTVSLWLYRDINKKICPTGYTQVFVQTELTGS